MKNKKTIVGVIMILAFVAVVGASFALTSLRKTSTKKNIITTGELTFDFSEEETNAISLTGALPITDRKGVTLSNDDEVFDFTVSANNNATDISYSISLERDPESTLPDDAIKVYLTEVDEDGNEIWVNDYDQCLIPSTLCTTIPTVETYPWLVHAKFNSNSGLQSKHYRLRMWVSKDADLTNSNYANKTAKYNVTVDGYFKYDEDITIDDGDLYSPGDTAPVSSIATLADGSTWIIVDRVFSINPLWYGLEDIDDDRELTLMSTDFIDLSGNLISTNTNIDLMTNDDLKIPGLQTYEHANAALSLFSAKLESSLGLSDVNAILPTVDLFQISEYNYGDFPFTSRCHKYLKGQNFILGLNDIYRWEGYYYDDGQIKVDFNGFKPKKFPGDVDGHFESYHVPGKVSSYYNGLKPVIKIKYGEIKDLITKIEVDY